MVTLINYFEISSVCITCLGFINLECVGIEILPMWEMLMVLPLPAMMFSFPWKGIGEVIELKSGVKWCVSLESMYQAPSVIEPKEAIEKLAIMTATGLKF